MESIEGRVAVVTGAASGIGLAVAHALLLVRGEHRAARRRDEVLDDLDSSITQFGARARIGEALHHEVAFGVVAVDLLVREELRHAPHRSLSVHEFIRGHAC